MHGLLLGSGNDAASALAGLSGGMANTARLMNQTAARLQACDTRAVNDSGLDAPGQVTSAYDLALFGRAALADPGLATILRTTSYTFPAAGSSTGTGLGPQELPDPEPQPSAAQLPGRHRCEERVHRGRARLVRRQRDPGRAQLRGDPAARRGEHLARRRRDARLGLRHRVLGRPGGPAGRSGTGWPPDDLPRGRAAQHACRPALPHDPGGSGGGAASASVHPVGHRPAAVGRSRSGRRSRYGRWDRGPLAPPPEADDVPPTRFGRATTADRRGSRPRSDQRRSRGPSTRVSIPRPAPAIARAASTPVAPSTAPAAIAVAPCGRSAEGRRRRGAGRGRSPGPPELSASAPPRWPRGDARGRRRWWRPARPPAG